MVTLTAGVSNSNRTLYHRIRFALGDCAALIEGLGPDGHSLLLVRDIEMARARKVARADRIGCSADFIPEGGLSGDRDTAMAQAVAECLRREGVRHIKADSTLPYLFAWHVMQNGIEIDLDPELGIRERRTKTADEIELLIKAQEMTAKAMTMACQLIARAEAISDGSLRHNGQPLTSESVRRTITRFLIDEGFSTPTDSIVATLPHVADCHHFGTGPLWTGQPVIVDIFPRDESSFYNGDCTRTVVHGTPSDTVAAMHRAVQEAKVAGCAALRPGTTGAAVHKATVDVILAHGFEFRRGSSDMENPTPAMRHGTGHGIGLDVHEPILLDEGGGEILENEVFTVEPGMYSAVQGGVRIEDMVQVTNDGHRILCHLNESLDWK